MRILQIRLKNLNSLVGEWSVDLTHPAYGVDGIFAIIGPTGAGKTTLLDAICLALYGRTPRLHRITKAGNEVMSRQTGECFAEVTFTTPSGRYRSHWSQHRARRRPDGELQAPKHEIANADTGEVYEAKLRGVAEQIEALSGMNFERFTRSMLLAQGSFAAFLQATPDERAPLLEQITGTEVYSQVSIRVHERRSQERRKLETLQLALNGLTPLSPDDEQQLTQKLQQAIQHENDLAQQIASHTQIIQWREGMDRLDHELQKLAQAQQALQVQIADFAPAQRRLDAANQALELEARHTAWITLQQAYDTHAATLEAYHQKLPDQIASSEKTRIAMQQAHVQFDTAKTAQQAAQPLLRKVRELDLKIDENSRPIVVLDTSIAEQAAALQGLQDSLSHDMAAQSTHQISLQTLQEQLQHTQADELLVQTLSALQQRLDNLADFSKELDSAQQAVHQAKHWLEDAALDRATQSQLEQQQQAALNQQLASLLALETDWQNVLSERTLTDWRKQHSTLFVQTAWIDRAIDALRTQDSSVQAVADLAQRQQHLESERIAILHALKGYTGKQQQLETERTLLETQLSLLQRIESLETARDQLEDGTPCPLCGALEHPYARGHVPTPNHTRLRLNQTQTDLTTLAHMQSDAKMKQVELAKELEWARARHAQHEQAMASAKALLIQACQHLAELPLCVDDSELAAKLLTYHADHTCQMAQIAKVLEQADVVEPHLAQLRTELDKARQTVAHTKSNALIAAHRHQSIQLELQRRQQVLADHRQRFRQAFILLQQDVQCYGMTPQTFDELANALDQLKVRRDQWLAWVDQKTQLERRLQALEQRIDWQVEQIRLASEALNKQCRQRDTLQQALSLLAHERQTLLGNQQADALEVHLAGAVADKELVLEQARQQHTQASKVCEDVQARISELGQSMQAQQSVLRTAQQIFITQLRNLGFASVDDYLRARLPDDERALLAKQAQQLVQTRTELAVQEREKTMLLVKEREKQLSPVPLHALSQAQTTLLAEQRTVQQEIGAMTQKLQDNAYLQQQRQMQYKAVLAQQCECTRWDLLHTLIGSADGKKYRNFAQGLTFETVIGHANRQLQKMSDRYLLTRDPMQPLELNVIDNYQAGAVRSTKNLSGGESFVVSLALALGLSQMASQNVPMDSLFLDEGFGTLDEEALDTALETLGGLQQDGKLIGVISHVAALKERISAQIQVISLTGGKSQLSGPGCSKVKAQI